MHQIVKLKRKAKVATAAVSAQVRLCKKCATVRAPHTPPKYPYDSSYIYRGCLATVGGVHTGRAHVR